MTPPVGWGVLHWPKQIAVFLLCLLKVTLELLVVGLPKEDLSPFITKGRYAIECAPNSMRRRQATTIRPQCDIISKCPNSEAASVFGREKGVVDRSWNGKLTCPPQHVIECLPSIKKRNAHRASSIIGTHRPGVQVHSCERYAACLAEILRYPRRSS
jgi:hypothetical protein